MASVLCITCGLSFESEKTYQIHKQSGHTIRDGSTLLAPPDAPLPTPEFMESLQRIEEHKKKMEETQKAIPPTPVVQDSDPTLKLVYLYKGNCPSCNVAVETIELEVADKYYIMARCPTCKKQLDTRNVAKL